MMKIVLASESLFCNRALDLIGLPYETRPSRIGEKPYAIMIPLS